MGHPLLCLLRGTPGTTVTLRPATATAMPGTTMPRHLFPTGSATIPITHQLHLGIHGQLESHVIVRAAAASGLFLFADL